ncbi:MAG: hypothetical protein KF912_06415 [Phycisphaeraceae bacterium]|nr:hypothetical protein [Phycisphaeraceae bacterium]
MTNPHETTPDPTNPKPSLDALAKRHDLDEELDWAKAELLLETLDTRGRDALDFHEIPVSAIRDVVRHAFESGYRSGLHTGYRQGRSDACDEARGKEARTQPRNPDLVDRSRTDPTT